MRHARALMAAAAALAASAALLTPARASSQSADNRAPALRFTGSTTKVVQLLGDEDKQRHQATPSLTVTRYGIEGTDLGCSFEHDGRVYFLFGDTVGTLARALDTIATTDAQAPDAGLRIDFLTAPAPALRGGRSGGRGNARGRARGNLQLSSSGATTYLTIRPPGISMGPFEVPVCGISLNGQMYVVVTTNHADDRSTDRSVLTKFSAPDTFKVLRTISQRPAGKFVKSSLHVQEPAGLTGLPAGGPYVLMWGTGEYRRSDTYLAIVPVAKWEGGQGTKYFAGMDARGAPRWSDREADATAVVRNGTMGDVSVTWSKDTGLWLMTYDSRPPASAGIHFAYSQTPWGPWSEPQVLFTPEDGLGAFIHNPRIRPSDGLAGPVIGQATANPEGTRGGGYAPYVVERWTRKQGDTLSLYYVLSTWNPYVVVLMKSQLHVE